MTLTIIQVAIGGAIGSVLRYLTNVSAMRLIGPGFPWGTVFVNIAGSFVMGVIVIVLAEKGGMRFAPLLMTGLLGGFTTFSAFSLDTFTIFERGDTVVAAAYLAGSVILSLLALVAGIYLTRGALA
jgi:CrcB protein